MSVTSSKIKATHSSVKSHKRAFSQEQKFGRHTLANPTAHWSTGKESWTKLHTGQQTQTNTTLTLRRDTDLRVAVDTVAQICTVLHCCHTFVEIPLRSTKGQIPHMCVPPVAAPSAVTHGGMTEDEGEGCCRGINLGCEWKTNADQVFSLCCFQRPDLVCVSEKS